MPFALLLIGAVILIAAVRGTHGALGQQITKDFTGAGNFWIWIAAIGAVGALGYSPVLRTPSRMLLALIVLGMILATKGGFFTKFKDLLGQQPAAIPASQDQPLTGSVPVTLGGGQTSAPGGGGNGGAGQAIGTAAKVVSSFLPFF